MNQSNGFFARATAIADTIPDRLTGNEQVRDFFKDMEPDVASLKDSGGLHSSAMREAYAKNIVAMAARYALNGAVAAPEKSEDVPVALITPKNQPDTTDYDYRYASKAQVKEMIGRIKEIIFDNWRPTASGGIQKECITKQDLLIQSKWLISLAKAHGIELYEVRENGLILSTLKEPLIKLAKAEGVDLNIGSAVAGDDRDPVLARINPDTAEGKFGSAARGSKPKGTAIS
jgi:hypothetical protein